MYRAGRRGLGLQTGDGEDMKILNIFSTLDGDVEHRVFKLLLSFSQTINNIQFIQLSYILTETMNDPEASFYH